MLETADAAPAPAAACPCCSPVHPWPQLLPPWLQPLAAAPAASSTVDLKIPDIGDFKDVAVIEMLVKVGDTVAAEQSLFTVESDKASMEIHRPRPAPSRR
jgi:pyruvate dehydrogenase E2 component (dihydrolipoamide acetyltransferase)